MRGSLVAVGSARAWSRFCRERLDGGVLLAHRLHEMGRLAHQDLRVCVIPETGGTDVLRRVVEPPRCGRVLVLVGRHLVLQPNRQHWVAIQRADDNAGLCGLRPSADHGRRTPNRPSPRAPRALGDGRGRSPASETTMSPRSSRFSGCRRSESRLPVVATSKHGIDDPAHDDDGTQQEERPEQNEDAPRRAVGGPGVRVPQIRSIAAKTIRMARVARAVPGRTQRIDFCMSGASQ